MVAEHGAALIVDAMSSFGALPIDLGVLPAAAVLASSNKCLEGAPGVGFAIVSRDLLERCEGVSPSLSLDLHDQWRALEATGQWRFTPPVQVVAALVEALRLLEAEGGPPARLERYRANFATLATACRAWDIRSTSTPKSRARSSPHSAPAGTGCFDFERFHATLSEAGFVIYPGKLTKEESFRVGCIGAVSPADFERLLIEVQRADA